MRHEVVSHFHLPDASGLQHTAQEVLRLQDALGEPDTQNAQEVPAVGEDVTAGD